jgi:hypothetical protein
MTTVATPVLDRIADAFIAGDTEELLALYQPDALVDCVVPQWRFQLQGREALREALLEGEFVPGRRVTVWHRTATEDGMLLELECWAPIDGEDQKWRALHQFRVAEGQVVEHIAYCSGFWDAATIARQAVEAPMVRAR